MKSTPWFQNFQVVDQKDDHHVTCNVESFVLFLCRLLGIGHTMSHHFNLYTSSPVKSDGFFSSFGSSFDGRELASDVVLISTHAVRRRNPIPKVPATSSLASWGADVLPKPY